MKTRLLKSVLLFVLFFLTSKQSFSQSNCPSCVSTIFILDSTQCQENVLRFDTLASAYSNAQQHLRVCKNSTMKYTLHAYSQAPCVYNVFAQNISVTGGTVIDSNSTSFTIQWGNGNSGLISFTVNNGNDSIVCNQKANVIVDLLDNPVASFVATPQPACFNNPTTIAFNSNASQNVTTFFWTFGDGFTAFGPNPSHNYSAPGTYQVCLFTRNASVDTNASGSQGGQSFRCPSCYDTLCKTVVIDTLPGPPITCIATKCGSDTATYSTTASGCSSYVWTVIGGTISSGQFTNTIHVLWGTGNPQGSVSLVTTGCTTSYCPQGTTVNVPIVPTSYPISGNDTVCVTTSETYSVPTLPATSYVWSVNSPATISPFNSNTSSVNIAWNNIGIYTINATYYDSTLHCGGNSSFVVYVRPKLLISGPNSACANTSTLLQSSFTNITNFPTAANWTISPSIGATISSGNGTPNVNILWSTPGTYTVTAVSTATGIPIVCSDASYTFTVYAEPIITQITGASIICPNGTNVYAGVSASSGIYNWTVTGGTMISLSPKNDSIQIVWNNSGPFGISASLTSTLGSCTSAPFIKAITVYPTPTLTGPTTACVDDTLNYVVNGLGAGAYNWYITPSNLGTVISGQGTSTAQIKWHGDNTPTNPLSAYLHFGICTGDSVLITINKPPVLSISSTGVSFCNGGINLSSTAVSGTPFAWTCVEHAITPTQATNTNSLTALDQPGNYNLLVTNINNTGCKVSATYNIPDIGRPNAQIYSSGATHYCLPSLPNFVINALPTGVYNYQWYMNGSPVGINSSALTVNSGLISSAGSYTFNCVVSDGNCKDTSDNIIVIVEICGTGGPCTAAFIVNSITGCNPFTVSTSATVPLSAAISNPSIFHFDDNSTVNSFTTKSYTSIGLKQFRICVDIETSPGVYCRKCIDTFATVPVAADFVSNTNCRITTITNNSTVLPPYTISSYTWTMTDNLGNPILPIVGSYNNTSIANPIATINQSGTYVLVLNVLATDGMNTCNSIKRDTITVTLPNASFLVANACENIPITLNNLFPSPTNYWNFGDASTSYSSPTSHAYSSSGSYAITHVVTNNLGCVDTATLNVTIYPNPVCAIAYSGSTTFCLGDSLILKACLGNSSYQWFKNGVAIPLANNANYSAKITGNYSFTAFDPNGCVMKSDTVSVTVNQPASITFTTSGSTCEYSLYNVAVPSIPGATYVWLFDNAIMPSFTNNLFNFYSGTPPYSIGAHVIKVMVTAPNGCVAIDSLAITINPNPSLTVSVSGPTPMCSNNLYQFVASSTAAAPIWNWSLGNVTLTTNNTLSTSSEGSYSVVVTDGITGCKATNYQFIQASPNLSLFPIGCDFVCDTNKLFLPIPTLNGNLSPYSSITWYDNAAPYIVSNIVGSGLSINLNSLLAGNHNISVIVVAANGCADTSTVYNITTDSCNSVPLSLNKLVFSAVKENDYAKLVWKTTNEKGVAYFELEKSQDGSNFSTIGKTFSQGNSVEGHQYSTKDTKPVIGSNFYRIKVLDLDGRSEYSQVEVLNWSDLANSSISIYPNPTESILNIVFNTKNKGIYDLKIIDVLGNTVLAKKLDVNSNYFTSSLSTASLSNGIYYLLISNGKEMQSVKVVVRK